MSAVPDLFAELDAQPDPVAAAFLEELFVGVEDGWLTLFTIEAATGARSTRFFPATATEEVARVAATLQGHHVWFGVATRRERLDDGRRGGAADCLAIVALWADIDVAGPNHATENLPATIEEALELIGRFPLDPTAIVATGGGLQPWWALAEPLEVGPESEALLARWGATWAHYGSEAGVHVDNVFDVARIMRLPGSRNHKTDPPEPVEVLSADWTKRYGVDDVDQWLIDPPPAPEPRRADAVPYIGPERPGDAYNARHGVEELLSAAGFQAHPRRHSDGSLHFKWPQATGDVGATSYPDGHATIWSETFGASHPAVKLRWGYDAFGLYAALHHGGDTSAAGSKLRAEGYGARRVERPLEELVAPAVVASWSPAPEPAGAPPPSLNLPPEFWQARPVLAHVHQAAHSRSVSPDAVLACVLARVAAYSSHQYEIPPIVGSPGSLNFYAAIVAKSGVGKSTAMDIAGELVATPLHLDVADDLPLGSGEGLAEAYMGEVEEDNPNGKGKRKVRQQVRHNAFITIDEGAAITSMMERSGSTVLESLRRGWSGQTLGQANASQDRRRIIRSGLYRLGLIVAFQPELAGRLLADAHAGTPQRFIFVNAVDPTIPDEEPEWPGTWNISWPAPTDSHLVDHRGLRRIRMGVEASICAGLKRQHKAKSRGETVVDELDSQEPMHRLKLAALLAILDGRLDVDLEDWALADTLWATSCTVRAAVVQAVTEAAERETSARIDVHVRKETAAEAARRSVPTKVARLAGNIARKLHELADAGEPVTETTSMLSKRLASGDRGLIDAVIDHAVASGWLRMNDAGRYVPGESRPA